MDRMGPLLLGPPGSWTVLALAAGPLGNLAAKKADHPKELAWRAGKALPEEGISRYSLEAAGAPGAKVVVGATEIRTLFWGHFDTIQYFIYFSMEFPRLWTYRYSIILSISS